MKRRKWIFVHYFPVRQTLVAVAILVTTGFLMLHAKQPLELTVAHGDIQTLREQVEQLAKTKRKPPIDAKVDRVWKAIPELNGLEVDVEATIKRAKTAHGEIPIVFRQVPPKIKLDDLGPQPIYRGNPEKRQMALMINVAWGTEYIPQILDILKTYHVKSTFFFDGSWLQKNPNVAKTIFEAGHEIGNHAYSHPDMAKVSRERALREITRTNDLIKQTLGITPNLFAPPSGSYTEETVKLAASQKMRTILWTLDTVDWKKPPSDVISRKIVSQATNGALVLMHPTAPTVGALRTIIPELQKKGFELVTVSELLSPVRQSAS
jgi:peptidoglycan-N-acetylglucosamine deacetylase